LDGTTTDDYVFDEFGSWPYYENGGQTPPTDGSLEPLPSNVIPRHYDISLDFTRLYDSIPSPQILGNVSIHLESFGNSTTNEILFHAAASIFIIRISLRDIGIL
jgi:hypothetical protein